jgi:mxaJ protein
MKRTLVMLGALALLSSLPNRSSIMFAESPPLRVCGDPDNLPFSNQKLEGFENKIATLIASELGTTATYFWWPHQRGLIKNTFNEDRCDVVIGIPKGYDPVLWTKPYYRTSYVIAYRSDKGYRLTSLDAPELKRLRIGIYPNSPPQEALARLGIIENVTTTYSLFFDVQGDIETRPDRLLKDLVAGSIDVAMPWGPLAGYYKKKLNAPLELVTLEGDATAPLAFDISMGVKKGNQQLKRELEGIIDRRQREIRAILDDYGIPLMPAHQSPAPTNGGPAPGGALKKNPYTGNAEAVAEGKKLFVQNTCSGCHGAGGGGGMGPSLIDDEWKFGSDDDTLVKLIKGQIADATMPKVYSSLPDEEIWKLLAFIRSVYAGDPSKINW